MVRNIALLLICLLSLMPTAPDLAQEFDCAPADGQAITLGAIFPGASLFSVQNMESFRGAEAMRRAVNDCGGVNGRPVEWLYTPASDHDAAQSAAEQMIAAGVPVIVGSGQEAVNAGASAAANDAGVVYWETTETQSSAGRWIFNVPPSNAQLGEAAARFAQTGLGIISPRVALVYEERERGQQVAEGVRRGLVSPPVIDYSYSDTLYDAYDLAEDIRDQDIDAVILSVFDGDGVYLWYMLREADANIHAWIHVGSQGYRTDICQRANSEGFISVDASGPVSDTYRGGLGPIYPLYQSAFISAFGKAPSPTADLSASGVYLLLHDVLPTTNMTADAIRQAALALDEPGPVGLLAGGLGFDETGFNRYASLIVRQQQGTHFCSIWPPDVATCLMPLLEFPTWRARALQDESQSCGSEI